MSAEAAALDPIGGMQVHTGDLTRALDERGVAQTVITATRLGAPRVARIGSNSVVVRVGVATRHLRQAYALPAAKLAFTRARAYDLVHAHVGEDIAVLPIALEAARRGRVPLAVTVHCSPRHTLPVVSARTGAVKLFGGLIERAVTARADAVFVLTRKLEQALAADGVDPARISLVPARIGPGRFASRDVADPFPHIPRPRVLFVGRLAEQKGVRTLLAAAPSVNADVVLVGDGPERKALEERAPDRTHFVGFVPHERIPAVLAHGDVLVLPSRYEELGSVLIEALWSGLPVVASRVGGIPEVVRDGETGILVPPGEPHALAAALNRVLDDPELARHLHASALRERERWSGLVERTLAVYGELTASRARAAAASTATAIEGA